MTTDLRVTPTVSIPERELELRFARSGGPGGQHVNTTSTKVELRWDVRATTALTEEQKARVLERLANRITADGVLVLTSSEHRSQTRNREAVVTRLATLVGEALRPTPPRRPTRPNPASIQRRLEAKRRRAPRKALRRRPQSPQH
ncbi:MAG: aminoacyl-tRNA hydrolase [Actinomycetota bacterium]|nr:aminoacyl-tRNA hydrolase [Actinomycetota bacterium]